MRPYQPESYYEQKIKKLYSKYLKLKQDTGQGEKIQIRQLANFTAINKTKKQKNCYRLKKAIRTSLFRSCASVIFPKLNYKRIERIGTKRSLIRIIRKTKSEEKFNELKNNPKTFVQKLVPSLGKWLKLQEDKVKKQYEKRRVEEVIRSRVFFIFETFTENIMKINPVKKEKNRKEKQKRNTNKQKDQDEEYDNDNESDEDDDQSNQDDQRIDNKRIDDERIYYDDNQIINDQIIIERNQKLIELRTYSNNRQYFDRERQRVQIPKEEEFNHYMENYVQKIDLSQSDQNINKRPQKKSNNQIPSVKSSQKLKKENNIPGKRKHPIYYLGRASPIVPKQIPSVKSSQQLKMEKNIPRKRKHPIYYLGRASPIVPKQAPKKQVQLGSLAWSGFLRFFT